MKKITPEQRASIELETKNAIKDICQRVGDDLNGYISAELKKLADSEVLELSRGGEQFYRAAKVMICALAPDRISDQWQAQSCIADTRRAKRWLKNRY